MFSDQETYEGQRFSGINLPNGQITGAQFDECSFVNCNFSSSLFQGCFFRGCTFKNCDLGLARIDGSSFKGVEFRKCKLIGVDWTKAAWGKKGGSALLKPVDFYRCVLNYSSFFGLELENIHLEDCTAVEVDFSEGNFKGASMKGTDFERSVFRGTNLEGANFVNARNYAISPTLNRLKKARFSLPEAMSLLYSMEIVLEDGEEEADEA